ncbi:MAG: hypothetical protein EOM14_13035, partial [Clostridia bacterium]|nr:hypothetical protein [Clostridia bacterium]
MNKKDLFTEMKDQLIEKTLFEQAKNAAYDYIDNLAEMAVSPSEASISGLKVFDGTMPEEPCPPSEVLNMLTSYGAANTIAQTGGKYFGFVCGGSLPVSLASKWLSDVWDQNSALFVLSPIAAKLEEICEKWIADLLGLFHFILGGLTALFACLPLIHVGVGAALLLGTFDSGEAAPRFVGWIFVL